RRALLVTFKTGGVTPGDSYLFAVNEAGQPLFVKMWVSIIPLKGIQFEFKQWKKLSTGARVILAHPSRMFSVNLSGVRAHATDPKPGSADRFADLLAAVGR